MPNGSFEDTILCPYAAGQVSFAKHWYLPTSGSSDYFNSCDGTGFFSTPSNIFGHQIPFHGNAYVGFAVYEKNLNYNEYIATQLLQPLKKDEVYTVSYYLSLSESSKYAINSIGVYFSNNAVFSSDDDALTAYTPQIVTNFFVTDKQNWTKVSINYAANGGEEYILIGNFKLFSNTDTLANDSISEETYYFIDSISVFENINPLIIPNVFSPNNDGVNDYWEFNVAGNLNCMIYNRWGMRVFDTNKTRIIWDGKTKQDEDCISGNYFYIVETLEKIYKGNIQLIR